MRDQAAGRAQGNAFGAHLAVGTGSSQPSGVTQTSTLGVTGAASVVGVPNGDNLVDLFYSVISPYRNSPNCVWAFRDSTAATIRKMLDAGVPADRVRVLESAGIDVRKWLAGFSSVDESVLFAVEGIRRHPLVPPGLRVTGLIINPTTGALRLANADAAAAALQERPLAAAAERV
jgi:hypothetical protein